MAWVRYPFHVKAKGKYYAPGEPVEVDSLPEALACGAEPAETPGLSKSAGEKPRRKAK